MQGSNPNRTVWWALFGFSGRIGRQVFALGQLLMITRLWGLLLQVFKIEGNEDATAIWGLAFLSLGIVSTWSSIALSVKRLRDLDWPLILLVVMFIPWVNLGFVVLLMALPSTPNTTRHGPPAAPPPGS